MGEGKSNKEKNKEDPYTLSSFVVVERLGGPNTTVYVTFLCDKICGLIKKRKSTVVSFSVPVS